MLAFLLKRGFLSIKNNNNKNILSIKLFTCKMKKAASERYEMKSKRQPSIQLPSKNTFEMPSVWFKRRRCGEITTVPLYKVERVAPPRATRVPAIFAWALSSDMSNLSILKRQKQNILVFKSITMIIYSRVETWVSK